MTDEQTDNSVSANQSIDNLSIDNLSTDNISLNTLMVVPADVTDMEVIAQGKRGIVLRGKYKGKDVAVKIPRPSSDAPNTIGLEATYLKKVNKFGIGPKLLFADTEYVVMEYVDGERIGDFLPNITTSPELILEVLNKVLVKLFTLDKEGINKFELTNPYKHIIVTKEGEPVFIDFERARHAARPKNISQFAQYLQSSNIKPLLTGIVDYEKLTTDLKNYQETKKAFTLVSSQGEEDDVSNEDSEKKDHNNSFCF